MAIRLQEMHPALVHLPVALLPVAIGADLIGRVTGSTELMETGRRAMTLAATGALVSAVTGLIAQEEVNVEGETRNMLITHRNLNVAATVVSALMARYRSNHNKPSIGYLAVGLASLALVTYTANLGGELVYQHGVGVAPADGQTRADAPELARGEFAEFGQDAVKDIARGIGHLAQETAHSELAPSLRAD